MHRNTVDRTSRYAQFAARAECRHDIMHIASGADDRVRGAGWQAAGAANAPLRVDNGDDFPWIAPARIIERNEFPAEQHSQARNGAGPARRTTIDWRIVAGDGLCVCATVRVVAALALGLREQRVDAIGECHGRVR
ncbi:MAG: hypothetical protein R3E77_07705 [Steroidobacteraceae bacterium]